MEDFKVLTNFEKETLKFLNSFRENPRFFEKELITLRDGLKRYRPNDPFVKEIDTFLKSLKTQRRMHELELNDSLSKYAKRELDKYMLDPESFLPAIRGRDCQGKVSDSYLGENSGIIYTRDAEDPLNVVEKVIFNEEDSHKVGKQILCKVESTQLGISHEIDEQTGENFTVLIFADNFVDDDKEQLPDCDLSELKMAFDLFDYDNEGRVKISFVVEYMKELGLDESDSSLFDIIKGMDISPYVSWPKFANYVYDRMTDRYTYSGLNDLFNIFKDNVEKNIIDLPVLRNICNYLNIDKTDGQLIKMIKECTGKETINFEDFCDIMGIEFDLLKSEEEPDAKTMRTIKIINKSLNKTLNKSRRPLRFSGLDTENSLNRSINRSSMNRSLNRSMNRSLSRSIGKSPKKSINFVDNLGSFGDGSYIYKKNKKVN